MNLISFIWQYRVIFLAFVLVIGVMVHYFFVRIPDARAAVYATRVMVSAAELKKSFLEVSSGTDSQVFNEPDITGQAKIQQIANVNSNIVHAQARLNSFKQDVAQPLGVGFGARHATARELQEKARIVVAQSQDVLSEYSKAGVFLADYYVARNELQPYLSSTRFIGYRDTAASLRSYSDRLQSLGVPSDFKDVHSSAIDLLEDAATTLDGIASGRDGVSGLMQLAQVGVNVDNQLFVLIGETSSTIQNARDLPDKLQSIGL